MEDSDVGKEEAIITINISPSISITVRGKDEVTLQRLLEKSIDLVKGNQQKIKELGENIKLDGENNTNSDGAANVNVSQRDTSTSTIITVYDDGSLKFESKKIFDLKVYEVITLVMNALNKPLKLADIRTTLQKVYRDIGLEAIRTYLNRELKGKTSKTEDDAYYLNGAGINSIQGIVKKCA